MKFQIKNRFTGAVQFECELSAEVENQAFRFQMGFAVKRAIEARADLSEANLSWANLSKANLSEADLSEANLSEADLSKANLSKANLSKANLSKADLSKANLSKANLSWANLSWANLSWANLSWANLSKANLSEANLSEADLSEANLSEADLSKANLSKANLSWAKKDFFARLLLAKNEALGLYDYLMRGKIDGTSYSGECACFCGTVANVRKENYEELTNGLEPEADSPTERLFLAIRRGDIPQNNQVSAIVATWMREFMDQEAIMYPEYEIVAKAKLEVA